MNTINIDRENFVVIVKNGSIENRISFTQCNQSLIADALFKANSMWKSVQIKDGAKVVDLPESQDGINYDIMLDNSPYGCISHNRGENHTDVTWKKASAVLKALH